MDKKSKLLFWVLLLAVVLLIGYTFYKTMILGDFQIVEDLNVDMFAPVE